MSETTPSGAHANPTKQRPGDQPLPRGGRQCVQDRLIAEIEARKQLGIERYGQPLMTGNGRDALRDAWEEVIDLAAYLTQMRMEQEEQATDEANAVVLGLPHGPFKLTLGDHPDGGNTIQVLCSCGRGYAFGRHADSVALLSWLIDHDVQVVHDG